MGQRTHVIVKFKDNENREKKITFQNQWGYGRILIYAGYSVLKAIETGIICGGDCIDNDIYTMVEKIKCVMNANVENGICTDWDLMSESEIFVKMDDCQNDDGFFILDITDLERPKYLIVKKTFKLITDIEELEKIKDLKSKFLFRGGADYYKIEIEFFDIEKYWDEYLKWYKRDLTKENFQELDKIVKSWISYIKNNTEIMDKEITIKEYY